MTSVASLDNKVIILSALVEPDIDCQFTLGGARHVFGIWTTGRRDINFHQ